MLESACSKAALRLPLLTLVLALLATPAAKAQLSGGIEINNQSYQLCAQQRVTKALLFDVVDVGVYAERCEHLTGLFDHHEKLLRFAYLRKVSGQQFTEGAEEFLELNLTQQDKERCISHYQEFNRRYQDVAQGDVYDLLIQPQQGITLFLNHQPLASLQQPDCALPYLNIWFGQQSMDNDFEQLQQQLFGRH